VYDAAVGRADIGVALGEEGAVHTFLDPDPDASNRRVGTTRLNTGCGFAPQNAGIRALYSGVILAASEVA
jgi:hypothetical protein